MKQRRVWVLWVAAALVLTAAGVGAGDPPSGPDSPAAPAKLTVEVGGVESDEGSLAFALFNSAETFGELGEPLRSGRIPVEARQGRWIAEGLPPGLYALSVYHDRNGNGTLDKGAFGMPTEPYGFSNDARGRFGPPGWKKARFRLRSGETTLELTVR